MAVSALANNTSLLTTDTSTVATNSIASTPKETEAAFSLPAGTQNPPTVTDDQAVTHDQNEQQQTVPDNQCSAISDDSNDVVNTVADPSVLAPELDSDQLSSQQLTPLQLALGQTFLGSSAPTLVDINTDTSAADTESTLLQTTNTNETDSLPLNSIGKVNGSSGKNTSETDTENSRAAPSNDNSLQSLNISVLTLPTMLSALSNNSNTSILTITESNVDYGLLSTSSVTQATNTSIMTTTSSDIENSDSLSISSWLTASTTDNSSASMIGNGSPFALNRKLTSTTNTSTSQTLTQVIRDLSLFSDSASSSTLSAMPNTPILTTSSSSTTQQLGEQLLETLKQQVSTQLSQKTQQTTIRLDPPSLGQLDIAIRIDGNKMTVQINAEHSDVRESLQSSREQLRQLLSTDHNGTVDVDIGQQQSSTPQQHQSSYVRAADTNIIRAAKITGDTTATSASSEPATTGDWLNTVV
jgi:flagellar hook-length control protein FliK